MGERAAYLWAIGALAAAIVVLRRPDALARPEFFADDGPMFTHALADGSLLEPYAGYLVVIQRVAMAIAAQLPPAAAPMLTSAIAVTVAIAVAWLIAVRLRSPVLALGFVMLGGTTYVLGTMVDIQWILGVYLLVVLFEPRRWDVPFVALVALQGPIALLLLPLFITRWWLRGDGLAITLAIAVGSGLQVLTLLSSERTLAGEYSELLTAVALRGFVIPLTGTHLSGWFPIVIAIPIVGLLAITAWRLGVVGAALLYVWAVFMFAGTVLSPYPSHVVWSDVTLTERHFYLPGVAVAALILLGAQRRIPAALALTPLLLAGMLFDFRLESLIGSWAEDSACIGGPAPCTVPVVGGGPGWDVHWAGLP